MATEPWYVTRERVKRALDAAETARRNDQIDDAIEAASRNVEGYLHRKFYPRLATETFDWPAPRAPRRAWKLYLDDRELASSTGVTVTVGGGATTLAADEFLLRPRTGPPFTWLEINLGGAGALSSGQTWQDAIGITAGVGGGFGYRLDDRPAGALAAAVASTSATTCNISDSSQIGVGTLLLVGAERMIVTARSLLTTGQTLQSPLSDDEASTGMAVTTGAAYAVGELLTVDSERVRVDDIAGNTLIVTRQLDGSALAAHTTGTTIYAPRTLTVERGAVGTTAVTHLDAAPLARHVPPGPVATLALAYTLNTLLQESSGYARVAGHGEAAREYTGRGIKELESDARATCGRKLRRYGGA